jgi:hypothetical protein
MAHPGAVEASGGTLQAQECVGELRGIESSVMVAQPSILAPNA